MLYKGFKPYEFQKKIIDDILSKDDMFYTMVCGRQIGKTLLLINMLLYYGINKPKSVLLWVSPYYSMAVKVLSQIIDAIEFTPITKEANKSIGVDLGDGSRRHPFVTGVLGQYLDHLKGDRKDKGFSPERIK